MPPILHHLGGVISSDVWFSQFKFFFPLFFIMLNILPRIGVPSGGDTKTKTQHQFSSMLMLVIVRGVIWVGGWITGTRLSNHSVILYRALRDRVFFIEKNNLSLLVSQRNWVLYMTGTLHCLITFSFFFYPLLVLDILKEETQCFIGRVEEA